MKKTSEFEHIKKLGDKWHRGLAASSLSVRSNPKLVGLDKIRIPLAERAALKASGFPGIDGFCIPKNAGAPTSDIQGTVDIAFNEAVEASLSCFAVEPAES